MIKKILKLAAITASITAVQAMETQTSADLFEKPDSSQCSGLRSSVELQQMHDERERYERIDMAAFTEMLVQHRAEFDRALTQEEKRAIITRPIIKYRNDVPLVHALSLAVSLAETSILEQFVTVIDDMNALDLCIRGYRQNYSMAHLALDPFVPFKVSVPIEDRMKVVLILGSKSADFSQRMPNPGTDYTNVPLHCGTSRGYTAYDNGTYHPEQLTSNEIYQLRACTLLFGVDPQGEIKMVGERGDTFPYYEVAFNIFRRGGLVGVRIHPNAKAGFTLEVKKAEEAARQMNGLTS